MPALQSLLKSDGAALPPKQSVSNILLAGIGGFVAIAVLAYLAQNLEAVLVLGSFGASCVLVFGFPDAPFSQPRNVVAGHLLSSFVGLLFLTLCGPTWWSVALAVGTAIALMIATRTVHPPAGSNPVIVFLTQPAWDFLLFPTLTGALLLVVVAALYNNLMRKTNYPKYW
ncbi:HPP family protein [Pontibacterium sp.]|uniref:HPP family protein n=1 Tax=Pontibacterium sp. TaxID=2036026 RepID=UPI003511B0A2